MSKAGARAILVLILSCGLVGCIESKSPLLPESEAINSPISGNYVAIGNRDRDSARTLDHWRVSQEGKHYKIKVAEEPTGKLNTLIGTLHRLEDRFAIFQFRSDEPARTTNY